MSQNEPLAGGKGSRRDPTAIYSGLLFIAFGIGFLFVGRDYAFGTARAMGPGYFPWVLSILLIVLGAIIVLFERSSVERAETPISYRALFLIPLSVVLFAFSVRGAGLVPAVLLSVMLCSFASPRLNWRAALLLAVVLAVVSGAIFVKGLGLPIPLVGPWLWM